MGLGRRLFAQSTLIGRLKQHVSRKRGHLLSGVTSPMLTSRLLSRSGTAGRAPTNATMNSNQTNRTTMATLIRDQCSSGSFFRFHRLFVRSGEVYIYTYIFAAREKQAPDESRLIFERHCRHRIGACVPDTSPRQDSQLV